MLNRIESKIMGVLYKECKERSAFLISPVDLKKMSGTENLSHKQLECVIKDLHADGYFDLVYSDRHGETVYCISLTEKGKGFLRNSELMKRNLIYRVFLSVGLAVLSFAVGLLLKAIFN
ncbi:MAG: hypothetical protein IJV95_04430 [Clostridia bacterium]|nr:hypothetical protein [Clostridia bacterium]